MYWPIEKGPSSRVKLAKHPRPRISQRSLKLDLLVSFLRAESAAQPHAEASRGPWGPRVAPMDPGRLVTADHGVATRGLGGAGPCACIQHWPCRLLIARRTACLVQTGGRCRLSLGARCRSRRRRSTRCFGKGFLLPLFRRCRSSRTAGSRVARLKAAAVLSEPLAGCF